MIDAAAFAAPGAPALAELSVYAVIYGCMYVAPLAALFALWRVRRGVANAGPVGFAARWIGGAAVIALVSFAATFVMVPPLKAMIAECRLTEVPGDFCEDQGVAAGIPMVIGAAIAVAWLGAVIVLKAAIVAWRLAPRFGR